MATFVDDFLSLPGSAVLKKLHSKSAKFIWTYLETSDLLNVSVVSRAAASLIVDRESLQLIISRDPRISKFGNFRISFSSDTKLGLFRRILHRLKVGTNGVLGIDPTSGRVVMDIGSAFNDPHAYLGAAFPVSDDPGVIFVNHTSDHVHILRELEVSSVDEYDDYNPVHKPYRTHRRGSSYFNSDIEDCLTKIKDSPFDLNNILDQINNSSIDDVDLQPVPDCQQNRRSLSEWARESLSTAVETENQDISNIQ